MTHGLTGVLAVNGSHKANSVLKDRQQKGQAALVQDLELAP